MFNKLIRESKLASYLLLFVRVYLGWAWLTAGWGKVTGSFDATGYLNGAIAKASGENPVVQGWWASFLDSFALPNVQLFNVLVAWGELLVGLGLILGAFTTFAALMGMFMNFAFLFSGTISTNPEMVILGTLLVVAGFNAGRLGLDRWIIPFLRNGWKDSLTTKDQKLKGTV